MRINNIVKQMQTESRAVNTKGQTQQEWMQAVKKAYPDAKITQAKMIDGTVQALLADGRKITWSADHSMSEARASSAAFRSSNARRSELNAMTPEERKAHEDKRAEQQKGADYRDPPEADYGPEYQDMVSRVKKLAGLGPMKTIYDPDKRVYKNVPTAVQPGDKK